MIYDHDWIVVPTDVLDDLWPIPVPMFKVKQYPLTYVEHLDRYVDLGVLSRTGSGTREDPYRYEVMLSRLGVKDADGDQAFIGFRPRLDAHRSPLAADEVPRDLLDRLLVRDAR